MLAKASTEKTAKTRTNFDMIKRWVCFERFGVLLPVTGCSSMLTLLFILRRFIRYQDQQCSFKAYFRLPQSSSAYKLNMREISILRVNRETLSVLNLLEHVSLATKGIKNLPGMQHCSFKYAWNKHKMIKLKNGHEEHLSYKNYLIKPELGIHFLWS